MSKVVKKLSNLLSVNPGSGQNQSRRRRTRRTRRTSNRRRVRNVIPRRPRTVSNPAWGRSLPAAYASHVRPRFNVMSRTATSARVAGCDLVYPMPNTVTSTTGESLFVVIPSNPAYWSGTRIAQFAPAYMNYRPISMTFSYIPQVAVTQQGTVFMGTLWNGASPAESIQQSLFTSNGGCLTQCYVPCDTRIALGSNLQQNLYTLNGDLNPDTNPFIFLAGVRGSDVVPGYFYVTYMFEFKNPIGQSWEYSVVGPLSQLPTNQPNSSLVLLNHSGNFGPGTILDYELEGLRYRGSAVTLAADARFMVFSNGQAFVQNTSKIQSIRFGDITASLNQLQYFPPGEAQPTSPHLAIAKRATLSDIGILAEPTSSISNNKTWVLEVPTPGPSPPPLELLNQQGDVVISFNLVEWPKEVSSLIGSLSLDAFNTFALKNY